MRLVGYMQTISLQRFWMFILIATHQSGWYGLYPDFDDLAYDEIKTVVHQMFDDSFVLCILQSILMTEWYLAGYQGMLEAPVRTPANDASKSDGSSEAKAPEERPLLVYS